MAACTGVTKLSQAAGQRGSEAAACGCGQPAVCVVPLKPRPAHVATAPRTLVSGIAVKGNPYQNSGRGRGCDSVTIAAGATADVGRRTTPQLSLAGSSGDLAISVREPNGNQECVQRGTSAAW